jgi:dipeptidyl aminopeptidase/acylaminoacyl peptidase
MHLRPLVVRGAARVVLVAGAGASPFATAGADAARRPMTVEDLWAVQRVGAPAVAPDGRRVAFTVSTYSMDDNKGQGDLWLADVDGRGEPRRLTWNKGPDSAPAWSPDGDRLAYVSKRGDDPAQVYVLSLAGGEPHAVTELPVAASDPVWLPDGGRIAFLAPTWPELADDWAAVKKRLDDNKSDKTKAAASESRRFRHWDRYVTDGQVVHVFVVDVATGAVRDVMPGAAMAWDLTDAAGTWDISPDGSEIAFAANATEAPHRTLDSDIWLVPTAGGTPRRITAGHSADDLRPRYTPDGRYILFGRGRRPEVDPDFVRLARYDRASGAIVPLADDWDAQPSGWTATADSRTILFHAVEHGRTHLWALGIDGGTPRPVVRGGNTGNVAVAGGRLVFTRDSLQAPAELWTVRFARRNDTPRDLRPLTAFNRDWAAALDLGSVRDATFAGAAGDSVQMFVVLPPGYDASRRYPLFQALHGGPHGAWLDQFHYRWNGALLASRGHVVALVNFHGSTGAGQAFCESILGAHGDKPFTDIMASCDWLVEQGIVDPARMTAGGGSYGGYLTDWILGHTDRFKALVSHAGVYDLMAQFASDATWGRPLNYGSAPWQDPARIDRWSPSRFAAGFVTPTLVLHGEKDYRVPVTQGINLYGVLTAKGVPARIVVFPDENHWILKPQASRLWHRELFAWIEKYVGAGPSGGGATGAGAARAADGARR